MKNQSDTVSRAFEMWRASDYRCAVTDFLSPGEKLEIYTEFCARSGNGMERCFFWGGCRGTERGAAVFLPEWCMPENAPRHAMPLDEERTAFFADYLRDNPAVLQEIPIVPLSVRGSGFRSLGHRDFMGGILSLGVDRAVIGDIAVLSESEALVFAAERIASKAPSPRNFRKEEVVPSGFSEIQARPFAPPPRALRRPWTRQESK